MAFHQVKPGECLASIAKKTGFEDYHTIYDHPQNAALKRRRTNANMLVPGDIVFIPDKKDKNEGRPTSARHEFQISNATVSLQIVVEDQNGKAFAGKPFELTFNGDIRHGNLGGDGLVEEKIPADLTDAQLTVHVSSADPAIVFQWTLALGSLQPVDTNSGVQARLNNLGFACGAVDGSVGGRTEAALRRFQFKAGLPVTGKIDADTRDRLRQQHDGN